MMDEAELMGNPNVLVVHEWFANFGGSENVAAAIRESFPKADLICLWKDALASIPGDGRVLETMLAGTLFQGRKLLSLPLMPFVWKNTPARDHDCDVAIVSSHLFAHHVQLPAGVPKLVYSHTPARYIWEPEFDSRGRGAIARVASAILRPLDRKRAAEAAGVAANSDFVRKRIARSWGLDARVIYPPVDVQAIRGISDWSNGLGPTEAAVLDALPTDFILGASRFIPYKRLDLVIRAGELTGNPVVIAGAGPEEASIRAVAAAASVPVHIVLGPSDGLLRALYQRALVYIFPPVEDFGIMPVEAMAAGTPVVANMIGGASESVVDGITGALFDPSDEASLASAVQSVEDLRRSDISMYSDRFSKERFQSEIRQWVADVLHGG